MDPREREIARLGELLFKRSKAYQELCRDSNAIVNEQKMKIIALKTDARNVMKLVKSLSTGGCPTCKPVDYKRQAGIMLEKYKHLI